MEGSVEGEHLPSNLEFHLSLTGVLRPLLLSSSHGFVIGHVVPEAQVGGPIALVHDGDTISVDAVKNTIDLQVPESELKRRRQAWTAPPLKVRHGTLYKYIKAVEDASRGCITDA